MKNPRRPTLRQKQLINKFKLIPTHWLVAAETNSKLTIVSKASGVEKVLSKV